MQAPQSILMLDTYYRSPTKPWMMNDLEMEKKTREAATGETVLITCGFSYPHINCINKHTETFQDTINGYALDQLVTEPIH